MREGGVKVESLENRPKLNLWVTDYWQAFQYLGSSRAVHQGGISPIPLTEIVAYLAVLGTQNVDDRLTFIRMIQSLDTVYVAHINARAAKRAKSERAKQQRRPRKRRK